MGTVTAVLTPAHSPLPLHHSNSKPVTAEFTLVLPQGNSHVTLYSSPASSPLLTRLPPPELLLTMMYTAMMKINMMMIIILMAVRNLEGISNVLRLELELYPYHFI